MRGRRTPDDVRAQVMQALLAGQGVQEAAEAHGIDGDTVNRWLRQDPEFRQVAEIKKDVASRPNIAAMVEELLAANLGALKRVVEVASTEDYIRKQSAADLAVLYGVVADKAYRLLAAAAAAGGGRGDSSAAPRQIDSSGEDRDPS